MRNDTLTRYLIKAEYSYMNVLLDNDNLKKDDRVTLEDDEREWKVLKKFETVERRSLKRGWNNNI